MREHMKALDELEMGDLWERVQRREPSSQGPEPPPRSRLAHPMALLIVSIVVIGLVLYGLWGLDGNGAQPMTGPTEPLSMSMDPAKIPISVRYPADWHAAVGSTSPMLTGVNDWIGLVISNEARAVPTAHPANRPAYFRVHPDLPPTYVTVQILRRDVPALHGPPVPETPLPLSMTNATATSGRKNFRYLTAQIDGTPVFISIEAGPDASAADLARANQIVASIQRTEVDGTVGLPRHDVLAGGEKMTLATAEAKTQLAFLLPNDPTLASNDLIDGVWARVGPGGDYVVVRYSTGVSVEIRPWPANVGTPNQHWNALLDEGIPGQIVDIGGTSVFVVPSGSGRMGSASFVQDQTLASQQTFVSIIGNGGQSFDDLESLAVSALRS